ncbi:dickkopf-related protein [Nanoarchaeota archaeon]
MNTKILISTLFVAALLLFMVGCDEPTGDFAEPFPSDYCDSANDCFAGQICDENRCVEFTSYCVSDDDCTYDEYCSASGDCIPKGSICRSDADCESGYYCDDGECFLDSDRYCEYDGDCDSGWHCSDGVCMLDEIESCVQFSTRAADGNCYCDSGYVSTPLGECVLESELCPMANSYYVTGEGCYCNEGYEPNANSDACVPIESEDADDSYGSDYDDSYDSGSSASTDGSDATDDLPFDGEFDLGLSMGCENGCKRMVKMEVPCEFEESIPPCYSEICAECN